MSKDEISVKDYIEQGFTLLHKRLDKLEENNDSLFLKKLEYIENENKKEETKRKEGRDLLLKIGGIMISIIVSFSAIFTKWFDSRVESIISTTLENEIEPIVQNVVSNELKERVFEID